MRIKVLSAFCLLVLSRPVLADPDTPAEQQAFLLEQLRLGQALYRDDMVENALGRLELVAPLDKDVALAAMEFSLHRGETEQAYARLQRLMAAGVSSSTLSQARALLAAYNEDGLALRQRAQLLAASGQPDAAMALYRQLWGDRPPGLQLGLEHWRTLAQVDGARARAISRLELLNRRFPGNPELRLTLARLWLAGEQPERALALLGELAGNPAVANRAAELEYNYLIDLPVSERSARLWQRFLTRYKGSSHESGGRRQWQQQRALLKDPVWRAGRQGMALAERGRYGQALPLLRRAVKAYPQHAGFHGAEGLALLHLKRYGPAQAALTRAVELEQDGRLISKWQDLQQYARSLVWVERGEQALAKQDYRRGEQAFQQAHRLRPSDVPPLLGLAETALAENNESKAERRLQQAWRMAPSDARVIYALVDFYRRTSPARALAVLTALPSRVRRDYAELESRLRLEQLTPQIEQARAEGRTGDAISLLRRAVRLAPPQPWLAYELATLLQQQGRSDEAGTIFAPLLQTEGDDPQVRHAHAQFLASRNDDEAALASLQQIAPERWSEGMSTLATRLAVRLRQTKIIRWRDEARQQADPVRALSLYARGLAASGELAPEALSPLDGAALTQASRASAEDDWLQRSLKRESADLYRRQNATLQVQQDVGWRTDNNPSGVNDLRLNTSMLRAEWPWVNGRAWVQAEQVMLNAGPPEADDRFGGCNAVTGDCNAGSLDTEGTGLAVGWQGERWSWDIGHSPLGFEISNWLGGLNYAGDWNELGYSLTLSRRPMSNSLVSYAGAVDPVTGLSWGGVTATGLALGLSHDQGEEDGIWASLGAHSLNGERVENNQRFSAMAGYYYRLIERPHEQLRAGSSLLYFQYQKDLSEDTLGQGGYYSPQRYVSLGLPVRYARRDEHWSGVLEASPGWSWSRADGNELYPEQWQAIENSGKPLRPSAPGSSDADTGGGPGISLAARGEYRLNEHWILGGGLNWQVSEDYAPGHGFVYLRYHFGPWLGDLDMPVAPLTPYAEWR
ncbi:cellulose synthase subunit BcsC-related outer membrane protein [Oceanimonas marisflavi]|uniref:cellulose synthase subunit BcsC-related outer membrane protein n=1 Tax=Oceanimonas marisflavi TaxID=2059724 RepID=UPI000D2FF22C|nr:cellulose synthase subunit BcsC-related outer membrane protein [Oceanimonas marisflavi]